MAINLDMINLSRVALLDGQPLLNRVTAPTLFDFEVIREGDHFKIVDFEHDQDIIKTSDFLVKRLNKESTFSHHEIERLPHDLALSFFNQERPKRVSEVLGVKHDTTDNRTPDLIGENFIFELGTSVHGPSEAFILKTKVYRSLAISRRKTYLVCGVGSEGTLSNFHINEDDSKRVVEAYILGRNIQIKSTHLGFYTSSGVSDVYKEINHSLRCVEPRHDKTFLEMSERDWENWSQQNDYKYKAEGSGEYIYSNLIKNSSRITVEGLKLGSVGGVEADLKLVREYKQIVHKLPMSTRKKKLAIPFVSVSEGQFEIDGMPDVDSELGELWYQLLEEWEEDTVMTDYNKLKNAVIDPKEEVELRMSKEHRTEMRKSNRIKVSLSIETEKLLSIKGYHAKKHNKKENLDNTQKSFGYHIDDTETEDIEVFINSGEDIFDSSDEQTRNYRQTEELLSVGGFKSDIVAWDLYQWFDTTNFASCLSFLSALFSELNLVHRKPTSSTEFHVSEIPGFKALLAVHNTGSSKHTFYTVLVHNDDLRLFRWASFFRQWHMIGNYYALDFSSTRRHDISNLLFCYQKLLTMFATHLEVFSETFRRRKGFRCTKEFLFHTLVYLENNNQTSETLQLVRYMYMKTNESKLLPTPLLSPIEKFPQIIRSRLCTYAIRSIIDSFLKMSESRLDIETGKENNDEDEDQIEDDDEECPVSEDFLKGVISYISQAELKTYEECLLLSYGGIYHNKEKSDPVTSNYQIYRKLTNEEIKLDANKAYQYKNGFDFELPEEIPDHGFSSEHIRNCALAILEELQNKGITEKDLVQRMLINLNKISFEEFATFKSSLDPDHLSEKEIRFEEEYDSQTCGRTIRAMEGVIKLINKISTDENPKPYNVFASIMNVCNDFGGIVTILFKKAQFGSVREIFILTMFARVVIRLVESLSRTIAECCSNEYLTKGREKLNSTPNHYLKVKDLKHHGDIVFNMFDSLDCRTWCQNFTFPAFGQLFSVLLRSWPEASNATRVVLNMSSAKRHEMTEVLMSNFSKNPDVNSFSDGMNKLKEEFLGTEPGMLNEGNKSIFIKNISNFMQGIFHYTSTIMHSGHMLFMSKIVKSFMLGNKPTYVRGLVHTTKVSSDDSSSLLTMVLKPEISKKEKVIIRMKMLVASEIIRGSYPLFCAKINIPKSTRSAENGVEEFNSFWTFRNTVLSVPSKFSTAAVCPKVTRSCLERQRVDHNSMNSCIENGCSMRMVKVIEICCALNHYIITGLEAVDSETWGNVTNDMLSVSHPSAWFYISSPKMIGPTLGFDLTLHAFLRKNVIGRRTQHLLTKKVAGDFDYKSGFLIQSSMMVGRRDKYNFFLKRIIPDDIDEILSKVDMDPYMLHRDSVSSEEILQKIYLKAKCPGAERSFIFEDESAVHSLSAYTISKNSMSVSLREDMNWERKKYNLPSFLNMLHTNLTMEEENFEVEGFASTILDITNSYNANASLPIGRRRKVPVKVRFPKTRADQDIPLSSVCLFHWFGKSNDRSSAENDEALEGYKKLHVWLSSSYSQTRKNLLDMGVEGNIHGILQALIHSEFDKDRTIMFLHTGHRQSTLINTYLSCLEYCQVKGSRLTRPSGVIPKSEISELYELESRIYPFVCIHDSVRRIMDGKNVNATQEVKKIFQEFEPLLRRKRTDRDIRFLPKRYRNLLAMGLCCLPDATDDDFRHAIVDLASGYLLTYDLEQRKMTDNRGKVSWIGKGQFTVRTKAFNAIIIVENDYLVEIRINNPNQIVQHLSALSKILKSMKITRTIDTPVMDGLRMSRGKLHYTNQKGARITTLPLSKHVPLERLRIFPNLTIEKQSFLKLSYHTDDNKKSSRGENVYFNPSQKRVEKDQPNQYQLEFTQARRILTVAASREESNPARVFVVESLIDRLSRRHMLIDSRYKRVMGQRTFVEKDEDDDIPLMTEELYNTMESISGGLGLLTDMEEVMEDVGSLVALSNPAMTSSIDPEVMIDEIDLMTEEKTSNSSPRIYEDLQIWDKFIDSFRSEVRHSLSEVMNGNYFIHSDSNNIKTLLESLIELGITVPPNTYEDEEEEDLDEYEDF